MIEIEHTYQELFGSVRTSTAYRVGLEYLREISWTETSTGPSDMYMGWWGNWPGGSYQERGFWGL